MIVIRLSPPPPRARPPPRVCSTMCYVCVILKKRKKFLVP